MTLREFQKRAAKDDPFVKLAAAIISQAAEDYMTASEIPSYLRKGKHHKRMRKCKKFFNSEWFDQLCFESDPDAIRKEIGIE